MNKKMLLAALFTIISVFPNFADSLDSGLESTISFYESFVSDGSGIGIGTLVFEDKNISSSLSGYLAEKLAGIITHSGKMTLVNREQLDTILEEIKLGLTGIIEESSSLDPGALKGLEYLITGRFYDQGRDVRLYTQLTDMKSSTVIADREILFGKDQVPRGILIRPSNYEDALYVLQELAEVSNASNSDFIIKGWTIRGDGGIYRDGERMVVNFYSSRDCYIKVYHIDVAGNMQLIFPNDFYSDNFILNKKLYRIPDNRYPFTFDLGAPYGTEFIKIVASTVQFKDIESAFEAVGHASGELVSRGLAVNLKKEQVSETLFSYTIIE